MQQLLAHQPVLGLAHDDARCVAIGARAQLDLEIAPSIAARIELGLELADPATHEFGAIDIAGLDLRHIQQLFEQPLVVAARPAANDGLHLHVMPREHLEA